MPHGHQLAQAVHAAGESGPVSPGTYAIVLSASLSALSELADKLAFYSVPHTVIREPDAPYLGEVTAIGLYPQPRSLLRKYTKGFKLC